jgi:hypothetical protein
VRLGYFYDQEIRLVSTGEPWRLPVQTLLVRAKSSLHGELADIANAWRLGHRALGMAMASSPEAPGVLRLERAGRHYRTLVAVADPTEPDPKSDHAVLATAFRAALRGWRPTAGVSATLFDGSAARLLGALHATSTLYPVPGLVVVFVPDEDRVDDLLRAWADIEHLPGVLDFSDDTTLTGGVTTDLVPADTPIDVKRDRLGVGVYAAMLATALVRADTPMPQSVGVFGEWGSGKSYFMGLLRGHIHRLSGTEGHCDRVVEIGFNAWNYADTDLWASLADVIFTDLADAVRPFLLRSPCGLPGPAPGEARPARRRRGGYRCAGRDGGESAGADHCGHRAARGVARGPVGRHHRVTGAARPRQ